jgi:FixJ family two-component response regulator
MSAPPLLVAIVDDEEPIRKALRRLLESAGVDVETFASGQEFLDSLTTRRPDCLILDLHMPGVGGLSVLQHMQSSGLQLPTVVITAYEVPDVRSACFSAGASVYLRKPLDHLVLLAAISEAIAEEPEGDDHAGTRSAHGQRGLRRP